MLIRIQRKTAALKCHHIAHLSIPTQSKGCLVETGKSPWNHILRLGYYVWYWTSFGVKEGACKWGSPKTKLASYKTLSGVFVTYALGHFNIWLHIFNKSRTHFSHLLEAAVTAFSVMPICLDTSCRLRNKDKLGCVRPRYLTFALICLLAFRKHNTSQSQLTLYKAALTKSNINLKLNM